MYAASSSGVTSSGEPSSQAVQKSARSRRYASTVRGASRAVESARKDSTEVSIDPLDSAPAAARLS